MLFSLNPEIVLYSYSEQVRAREIAAIGTKVSVGLVAGITTQKNLIVHEKGKKFNQSQFVSELKTAAKDETRALEDKKWDHLGFVETPKI